MGTCTVWWAAPVAPSGAPGLVGLLDAHERERLARFRREGDAARYLAAHALTRRALGERLDADPAALVFDRTCRCGEQHGKPRLAQGPGFSFTHAGDVVGLAVHDGPVGLDVEQARPLTDLAGMAEHACAPDERVTDTGEFFRLWTRKEALLKSTGEGLSTPMADISIAADGAVRWGGRAVWLLDLSPAPGYPAALAGPGPAPPAVIEADGHALLRP
ncbi:4'-phosphopantetheinyl transferase family protein [Pseudonocardia broussonetiae]|uniref:4'-phosphopantetheinyl transferase family protein n=1 Tax=Pseudonocardia broussonetiae TaxID=2736640 RepID=UPI001F0374E4|nr:4'-phosphopantetheinyl transferase superfamily protein [Pseudonocardia broussonetiae]